MKGPLTDASIASQAIMFAERSQGRGWMIGEDKQIGRYQQGDIGDEEEGDASQHFPSDLGATVTEPLDEIFSTGDYILDQALGGGIRTGMLWEIVGER